MPRRHTNAAKRRGNEGNGTHIWPRPLGEPDVRWYHGTWYGNRETRRHFGCRNETN